MNVLKAKWVWLLATTSLVLIVLLALSLGAQEEHVQTSQAVTSTPAPHRSIDLTPDQMTKKQQLPLDQQDEYEQNIADRQSVDKVRLNQQQALKTLQDGEQKFKDLDAKAEAIIKKLKEGNK